MLPIMFDNENGAFVKYVCLNCAQIETANCNSKLKFDKFVNLLVDNQGLCRKCKSPSNRFKNGWGQEIWIKQHGNS